MIVSDTPAAWKHRSSETDPYRSIPIYEHGGNVYEVSRMLGVDPASITDLSATLNPFAPDLSKLIKQAVDMRYHRRYPDEHDALKELADSIGISPDQLLLTHGGSEAISLVARACGRGYCDHPEFSLYERYLPEIDTDGVKFRSNPRNPTGELAAMSERAGVWDEAFYQMTTGQWTRRDFDKGSYVLGSLTKLLACPGIRIGYVICPDEKSMQSIRLYRPEWTLGGIECYVLANVLNSCDIEGWSRMLTEATHNLADLLSSYGLRVDRRDAPWILVQGVDDLDRRLIEHGVLIRDCTNFNMPGTYRISACRGIEMERLDKALAKVLSHDDPCSEYKPQDLSTGRMSLGRRSEQLNPPPHLSPLMASVEPGNDRGEQLTTHASQSPGFGHEEDVNRGTAEVGS